MDKQKVDEIITKYLKKIYGFAIKKAFSYDEADDLCSDIIHEVYISLLKSDEVINLEGYIWRISEHTYSKYVSSKKKHDGISINGMEIPYFDSLSFDNIDEDLNHLRREIAYLTETRRKIVYLFYYENKSVSYLSKEMGIPEGTIKWHLNKARNELKEGFFMERKIGKLGLSPITSTGFTHSGNPGSNSGPEFYLGDKLNLNIVYSVYFEPKTKEQIAEELGVTPVYLEEKINFLEGNGFLVKTSKNRYTTYVCFFPETYSLELIENNLKMKMKAAEQLVKEYVPAVRSAIADMTDVYIPSGNRELLEAAAIFYAITNKGSISCNKDLSKYVIKTTAGGVFITIVNLPSTQSDPEYVPTLDFSNYWACGDMTRWSEKYPSVYSWSMDSKYCSRKGTWENNLTSDYEYLYEFITGNLPDTPANAEKYKRLKEREFLSADNQVNIMVVKDSSESFFSKIPPIDANIKNTFANFALEWAMINAKNYPPQIQDLIISRNVSCFIGFEVALMVMDILYNNGTFRPLTEREKITSDLIMFSDVLPQM